MTDLIFGKLETSGYNAELDVKDYDTSFGSEYFQ